MSLRVLVLTPRGRGGVGGIDRVMDTLRAQAPRLAPAVRIAFVTTRGRSIAQSPLYMGWAALRIGLGRLGRQLDVIHINLASNASAYRKAILAAWCRTLGLPYVLHLHGADFASFWPTDRSHRRRMIDRMFLGASGIVVLGVVWARLVETRLPQTASRLHIVPNASPAPDVSNAERDPKDLAVHVLFLGELGERKGVPLLLRAFTDLHTVSPWRATLAGEGAIAETRHVVQARGLPDRVIVPGWVGPAEVARLLAAADVLVLPSFSENLPMAVIEAMAAGLAVIATDVGATCEIVRDGETGLLVAPGDEAGLVAALHSLIDGPDLRRRLGAGARAFHRAHLDPAPFADRLTAIWTAAALKDRGWRQGSGASGEPA